MHLSSSRYALAWQAPTAPWQAPTAPWQAPTAPWQLALRARSEPTFEVLIRILQRFDPIPHVAKHFETIDSAMVHC